MTGVKHQTVPFPDDNKIIDIGDYYGDYSRFAGATGWNPRVDLSEGIERTVAYYRQHPREYWA